MKISQLKIKSNNPRKIDQPQIEKLMQSIKDFPKMMELRPIVYDPVTMEVLGGNQRLTAIKKLGMKDIPDSWTRSADTLSDDEKRRFVIQDNHQSGEWDFEILNAEWGDIDLKGMGIVLPDGYDTGSGDAQDDDFETPDNVQTIETNIKRGDIIEIGNHRLMCGDSTSESDVKSLLLGNSPEMMVTDPPYGVEYDPSWRTPLGLNDNGAFGKVENDDRCDWTEAWKLSPSQVCYVYHASVKTVDVFMSLANAGFEPINLIIWNKSSLCIGRGDYHHKHEPIWYMHKKGKTHLWAGSRKESTVWDINKPSKTETIHSTQKPVECMSTPIKNHTAKSIYDPFIGSGTTMVACHQLDRICYGMEISPQYCQVVIDRMKKLDAGISIKINGEEYVG